MRAKKRVTVLGGLLAVGLVGTPATAAREEQPRTAAEWVDAMVSAHGGLSAWASAPTVTFTDSWFQPGSEKGQTTTVTVEQGRRRSYLDTPDGASIVWDGQTAWSVNWASPAPPRFMAQLNYYFLNLPWLVMDPGVILGEPGTARLWDDPIEYLTIHVTYEAGVGDTPDDYYTLYIHPETHRLKGCKYVVTYAELLPEGVKQTPAKILVFDEFETVDGLLVPTAFTIYQTDHTLYARCEIENWSFRKPFDESRMAMPENGVVDTSKPTLD